MALPDFKEQLKKELKPSKIKHFSKGSKIGNTLLTRIRIERSDLNLHKFTIGHSETTECLCHAKQESSLHFLIDCFLYSGERQTLFSLVEHYIPKFSNLSKSKKCEVLVMGIHNDNPVYKHTKNNIHCRTKFDLKKMNIPFNPPSLSCPNVMLDMSFIYLSYFYIHSPLKLRFS